MRDRGVRGQSAEKAARIVRDVLAAHRQALDVRLVDDRLMPGVFGPAVVAPGEGRINHHRLEHPARIVAPIERQIEPRAAGAVAEMRVAPHEGTDQALGIGIEQQFVRIEAMPLRRIVRAVDAIAVDLAARDLGKVAVPDVVGAFGQRNAFELAAALAIEQTQLDLLGIGGEQREVRPATVPCRAEPVRLSFQHPHVRPREPG